MCWLFHQMRSRYLEPDPDAVVPQYNPALPPEIAHFDATVPRSYFHRACVVPLYTIIKKGAKKARPPRRRVPCREVLGCCHRVGRSRPMPNSEKINYDDVNEVRGVLGARRRRAAS